MRQLMRYHRFQLCIIELVDDTPGKGDSECRGVYPLAKAFRESSSRMFILGIGIPLPMHRFSTRL